MNAITTHDASVSAGTLEHVLGSGDLSKLTPGQRVEYMLKTCQSIGLNPLTRPFRLMSFQGTMVLYATRDCGDQLRSLRGISVEITDKKLDGGIYIVTARATTKDGRTDEDVGAVAMGTLQGEARCNAVMKAMTKAKRRVTLSICGLGMLDESEVESMRTMGATIEPDAPAPEAPPPAPPPSSSGTVPRQSIAAWLDELERDLDAALTADAVLEIGERPNVIAAQSKLKNGALARFNKLMSDAISRTYCVTGDGEVIDQDGDQDGDLGHDTAA